MRLLDFDWRRLFRWCLLLSFAMVIWLLVPTAKCTYHSFRDTPLTELQPDDEPGGNKPHESSFWSDFAHGTKTCYRATPLLGQQKWKRDLLLVLVGLMTVSW